MSTSNGITAMKKAPIGYLEGVKGSAEHASHQATKAVERELGRARRTMVRVAEKVEKTAKSNPLAAAGVLVGAGALLGVLLHATLHAEPTAGDLFARAVKRGTARVSDTMTRGVKSARRAIR